MAESRPRPPAPANVLKIRLPFLPRGINLDDIKDASVDPRTGEWRLFLHTREQRNHIFQMLKNKPDDWYKKSMKDGAPFDSPHHELQLGEYDVIVYDGKPYALYKGVSKNAQAGAGSFGVVKYAQDLQTGEFIAPKIYSQQHRVDRSSRFEHHTEDDIKKYSSQDFLNLRFAKKNVGNVRSPGFKDSEKKGSQYYFFMKIEPGVDLFEYTTNYHTSPLQLMRIMKSVCDVVHRLHRKMLHRDLKLENIMVNPEDTLDKSSEKARLIDFGMLIHKSAEKYGMVRQMLKNGKPDAIGTPRYAAPETYEGYYGTCSDVHQIGETFTNLLRLQDPNQAAADRFTRLVQRGTQNHFIRDPLIRDHLYDLCAAMKLQDYDKRPSLPEVSDYLSKLIKLVKEPYRVIVVDIQTIAALKPYELEVMLHDLKSYDEVYLASTDSTLSLLERLKYLRMLENAHIYASGTMYISKDMNIVTEQLKSDLLEEDPIGLLEKEPDGTIKPDSAKRYEITRFDPAMMDKTHLLTEAIFANDQTMTEKENRAILRKLLKEGANPNATVPTDDGFINLLCMATYVNNRQALALLLRKGANPNDKSPNGDTPLLMAIRKDNLRAVRRLLRKGADPNATDDNGNTMLYLAIYYNASQDIMTELLRHGAKPNKPSIRNLTPLILATHRGDRDRMKLLLAAHADPNLSSDEHTPLCMAVEKNSPKSVKLLLQHAADPSVKDRQGKTPRVIAQELKFAECEELLSPSRLSRLDSSRKSVNQPLSSSKLSRNLAKLSLLSPPASKDATVSPLLPPGSGKPDADNSSPRKK